MNDDNVNNNYNHLKNNNHDFLNNNNNHEF